MSKKLSEEQICDRFNEAFDHLVEATRTLKLLKRSFHRLTEHDRELMWRSLSDFVDDLFYLEEWFEDKKEDLSTKSPPKKSSQNVEGVKEFGDTLIFGMMGALAGIAGIAALRNQQSKVDRAEKFNWPDAIDLDASPELPKLLKD